MPRQESGEPYFRVDSGEAREMLEADPDNTVVIDVRRPDEWVSGHAAGAVHIEIDELPGRLDELPQGKRLLFICAMGVRSGLACEFAVSGGFDPANLYNIDDGTPAWIAAGNPTAYGDDP